MLPTLTSSEASTMAPSRFARSGFTIVEILVASAVLAFVLFIVLSMTDVISGIWKRTSNKIDSFQDARIAFDTLTRNLSQATLNTYLDYDSPTNPQRYIRQSELKFVTGPAGSGLPGITGGGQVLLFQAPTGYLNNTSKYQALEMLLNTCGYYVDFTTNSMIPPHVASGSNTYRYRLMQLMVPADQNQIYKATGTGWFSDFVNQAIPVADNVIALIFRPQDPASTPSDISTSYVYDSTANTTSDPQPDTAHQLPPLVQVTMIALDEASFRRISNGNSQPSVISNALQGRFLETQKYDEDLNAVLEDLQKENLTYRVFTSAVPIRESKWTK
jgi:uncharacterized protein (TIGR02599 family)